MDDNLLFIIFIGSFLCVILAAQAWSAWEASEVKPPEAYRVVAIIGLVLSMFVTSVVGFNLLLTMYK